MKFLERFWFGCGHCHTGQGCPVMEDGAELEALERGQLAGGLGLVATVTLVFLLPLATAIGGAAVADRWWAGASDGARGAVQAGGAAAGFLAGVVLAKLVFWMRRRSPSKEGAE